MIAKQVRLDRVYVPSRTVRRPVRFLFCVAYHRDMCYDMFTSWPALLQMVLTLSADASSSTSVCGHANPICCYSRGPQRLLLGLV